MNNPTPQNQENGYEPLFSYGHLRGHYFHSDMTTGSLHIHQFVRPEHLTEVRAALLANRDIFSTSPNTLLQTGLSPVSRQCLWELHSGIMLRVLENITGLHNLLPDTHCKQSRLLAGNTATAPQRWKDNETGLVAQLVLLLLLDSGDAELCTTAQALAAVKTGPAALLVTYWQHGSDVQETQP